MTPVSLPDLRTFAEALLRGLGVRAHDARAAAEVLCYADARGLGTHGVGALASIYGPRLRDGRIDPTAVPRTLSSTGAVATIDARGGLGLVAMTRATDHAGALAREHGIGMVAVRDSSHFGAAGYYAHRLADTGLIGIVATNCGNQGVAAPLGGDLRLLGTNPLGAAVPGGDQPPLVLDMSATVAATGKIGKAHRDGTPVPAGWLVGSDGTDVTDPGEYVAGRAQVRWLGGDLARGAAKGFGLAVLVDLLCGPLAGAGYGPRRAVVEAGRPAADDDDVGHVAIAVDPAAFSGAGAFADRAGELLGTLRACPPAPYAHAVTYPGEIESHRAADADRHGVTLPPHLLGPLTTLAAELDIDLPAALRADEPVPAPVRADEMAAVR